jgi:hypothetical protein
MAVLRRVVLAVLLLTPMQTFALGCLMKVVHFPVASLYGTTLAFVLVPLIAVWASVRGDPLVRDLPRLGLWSVFPCVAYDVVRWMMHGLFGIVFWDHWYDYGSSLTGEPMNTTASLLPGMALHALQGWVLAIAFYVGAGRPSLGRALGWAAFLTAQYYVLFPIFVLVDFRPKPVWYVTVGLSHLGFGLVLWAMPKLHARLASRPWLTLGAVAGSSLAFLFVPWRAARWQFPRQDAIDQASIGRLDATLTRGPFEDGIEATPSGPEARYSFELALHGRVYEDYIHAVKMLDLGPVVATGRA